LHMGTHTGKELHKCSFCDKTFDLKPSFDNHVRVRHRRKTL
jgi:hypothetical protein